MYPDNMGSNQVFREDFTNVQSLCDNGGVITGSVVVDDGISVESDNAGYVTFPDFLYLLQGPNKFTAKLRVKTGADIANASYFFSTYDGATLPIQAVVNTSKLQVYFSVTVYTNFNLVANTEYNLTLVYDGTQAVATDRLKIYNNGVVQSISNVGTIPTSLLVGDGPFQCFAVGGTSDVEVGTELYDLEFFSEAWTAEEALDAYENDTYSEVDASKAAVYLPLRSHFLALPTNGVTVVTDGDMELAGVVNWPKVTADSVEKVPGDGGQVLQVTTSGQQYVRQIGILTVGKTYTISARMCGDGSVFPRLHIGSFILDGDTGTDFQSFSATGVATSTELRLYASGAGVVKFNDIVVIEHKEQTKNLGTGGNVKWGDGSTASTQPTQLYPKGFEVDGGDYLLSEEIDLTTATGLTMFSVLKTGDATSQILASYEKSGGDFGAALFWTGSAFQYFGGGVAGGNAANGGASDNPYALNIVFGVTDGTNTDIYVNGVKGTSATSPLALNLAANQSFTACIRGDLTTLPMDAGGVVYGTGLFPMAMTPRQVRWWTQRILSELNNC
jgi:hypothetical protein